MQSDGENMDTKSLSYREVISACESALRESGIADAAVDAWLLFSSVTRMDRSQYYLHMNEPMPENEVAAYQKLAEERSSRIPLQYILEETEFMGLPFRVTPDVLIPRQDTEILVEEALKLIQPGMRVLDLCTGSGCIAISLAKLSENLERKEEGIAGELDVEQAAGRKADADGEFYAEVVAESETETPTKAQKLQFNVNNDRNVTVETCTVTASDISEAALVVAQENARINDVQVSFVQSDLFSNIEGTFDMIVSNPPYIPRHVIEGLEPEVTDHEPHGALDGGEDGLDFYRRIVAEALAHLKPGGWILFEIGCEQGEAVMELLREAGYEEVSCKQDLAHLDRVVLGRR